MDPNQGEALRRIEVLEESSKRAATVLASDSWGKDSLSGEERNRLFISNRGESFTDISIVSGADHVGDGRSVALLDFDRDGWIDIGSINTNSPKLVLFRNRIGRLEGMKTRAFAAIKLVGGNNSASPSRDWSNRDGYGAKITLRAGGKDFITELRCGEGYSAQNSTVIHIGLGSADQVEFLNVRWPSGRQTTAGALQRNQLVTVYENPQHSPDNQPYQVSSYRPNSKQNQ